MQRAVSLLFESKVSGGNDDRDNSASASARYPPSWSLTDAEEERLLSYPEVARYVDAMNQTAAESLGGCGPTPRKIRLSSGFSGWSPFVSPVKPSTAAHTGGKSRHRSVDMLPGQQGTASKSNRTNSVVDTAHKNKPPVSSSFSTDVASCEEIEYGIAGESMDDFGGSMSCTTVDEMSSSSSDKANTLLEKLIEVFQFTFSYLQFHV